MSTTVTTAIVNLFIGTHVSIFTHVYPDDLSSEHVTQPRNINWSEYLYYTNLAKITAGCS